MGASSDFRVITHVFHLMNQLRIDTHVTFTYNLYIEGCLLSERQPHQNHRWISLAPRTQTRNPTSWLVTLILELQDLRLFSDH